MGSIIDLVLVTGSIFLIFCEPYSFIPVIFFPSRYIPWRPGDGIHFVPVTFPFFKSNVVKFESGDIALDELAIIELFLSSYNKPCIPYPILPTLLLFEDDYDHNHNLLL